MPRTKGAKNKVNASSSKIKVDRHGNEKSNSKVDSKFIKAKKVVNNSTTADEIKESNKIKGRRKGKSYTHVLWLTDGLYITCDSRQFIIRKVNDKTDKDGKKLPDMSILYAQSLEHILKVAVNHMIKVPSNFDELLKAMEHIYGLIDARIPVDIKPKDLFVDIIKESGEED